MALGHRRLYSLIAAPGAIAAVALLLGGCGDTRHRQGAPAPGGPAAPVGRVLVYFKRVVGVDPVASHLTVYTNGRAVAVITFGGLDGAEVHRFEMPRAELDRLRRLIRHTHLRDTSCCDLRRYLFWVTAGGPTHRLRRGSSPALRSR